MIGNVLIKVNSFYVIFILCEGENVLNFMNINIVFIFRYMD